METHRFLELIDNLFRPINVLQVLEKPEKRGNQFRIKSDAILSTPTHAGAHTYVNTQTHTYTHILTKTHMLICTYMHKDIKMYT